MIKQQKMSTNLQLHVIIHYLPNFLLVLLLINFRILRTSSKTQQRRDIFLNKE